MKKEGVEENHVTATIHSDDTLNTEITENLPDFKRNSEDSEEGECINYEMKIKNEHQGTQPIFESSKTHCGPQSDSRNYGPLKFVSSWMVEKKITEKKKHTSLSFSTVKSPLSKSYESPKLNFNSPLNLESIEYIPKASENIKKSFQIKETKASPSTSEFHEKKDAETQTHIESFRSLLLQMLEECDLQMSDKTELSASSEVLDKPLLPETKSSKPDSRPFSPFHGFSDTELPFVPKKSVKLKNIKSPETSRKKKHYIVVEQLENVKKLRAPNGVSLTCPYCKKIFFKKDLLNLHIKRKHLNIRNCGEIFECDKCDYVSRGKHLLVKHKKFHNPQKMFRCVLCSFVSRYGSHVNRHYSTVHEKVRRFQCKECHYSTFASSTLKVHVLRVHSNAEANFSCPHCDFKALMRSELTSHIKTVHERTKIYVCSSCDFETSFNHNLKSHVEAVHLKIKKFECSLCSSKFFRKTHLLRHINVMHGTKTNKKRRRLKAELCEL